MGNAGAKADLRKYRLGYPGQPLNDAGLTANLEFYANERSSRPDGATVEMIHERWQGKYDLLETHHGYIQWLFPIHEPGVNYQAQVLQRHEAAAIAGDPTMRARVVRSFELMLDFYGMELTWRAAKRVKGTDPAPRTPQPSEGGSSGEPEEVKAAADDGGSTGVVASDGGGDVGVGEGGGAHEELPMVPVFSRSRNYKPRYDNLNSRGHNNLRITRMLKSLGLLGLEHLKLPWLRFLVEEIFVHGELQRTADSCRHYWIPTLKDDDARRGLLTRVARLLREEDPAFSSDEEADSDGSSVASDSDDGGAGEQDTSPPVTAAGAAPAGSAAAVGSGDRGRQAGTPASPAAAEGM